MRQDAEPLREAGVKRFVYAGSSSAETMIHEVGHAHGRSHSPAEWTAWEDIETGANVAINTLYRLAS